MGELTVIGDPRELDRLILEGRVTRESYLYELRSPRRLADSPEHRRLFEMASAQPAPTARPAVAMAPTMPAIQVSPPPPPQVTAPMTAPRPTARPTPRHTDDELHVPPLLDERNPSPLMDDDFLDHVPRRRRWPIALAFFAAAAAGGYYYYWRVEPGRLLAAKSWLHERTTRSAPAPAAPPAPSQPAPAPAPTAEAPPTAPATGSPPAAPATASPPGSPTVAPAPAAAPIPAAPAAASAPQAPAAPGAPAAKGPAETTGSGSGAIAAADSAAPPALAEVKVDEPAPEAPAPAAQPRRSYAALIAEGERHLENGRSRRAALLFQQALAARPNSAEAVTGLAYAELDQERVARAINLFNRALGINGRYGRALFGLAEAYQAIGNQPRALEMYRMYLQRVPNGEFAASARRHIERLERSVPGATDRARSTRG